ncbi:hypothetical protein GYMLUDRAFT_60228 [Collybiopsis luxurians FD-317 M1]|uniref:Uncharacterized protein n=1 Tax=Collybiopsis luxurians FD-317 M1 TaxID=944289 RepID=A0A0D0CA18_9AGAR|nr:hypothetical protein GYMLUDRAFT_60228 [Collybiopsis luxurians FD-317 M1]
MPSSPMLLLTVEAIDDISSILDRDSSGTTSNVGAIFRGRNVSHFASGLTIFNQNQGHCNQGQGHSQALAPVTAVFASDSKNNDDSSETSFSSPTLCSSNPLLLVIIIINNMPIPPLIPAWTIRRMYLPATLPLSDIVNTLSLCCHNLQHPEPFCSAFNLSRNSITQYIKFVLHDPSNAWSSCSVCTLIVPTLCTPMILGLPFLIHNNLVVDYASHSVIYKPSGFDLLHPSDTLPLPP